MHAPADLPVAPLPPLRLAWQPDPRAAEQIATTLLASLRTAGWRSTWSDCNGFTIDERTRVWLDGYQDLDFAAAYLLRVWTEVGDGTESVTVTDHLSVLAEGDVLTAWRETPHLFFDIGERWLEQGLHWWVDVVAAQQAAIAAARAPMPEAPERLAAMVTHGNTVRGADHERARRLGIAAPA